MEFCGDIVDLIAPRLADAPELEELRMRGESVDFVKVLGWLAEQGVIALLKADGERMSDGVRPWTFVASVGVLVETPVRIDAASPTECLRRAEPLLARHGLILPGDLSP